MSLVLIAEDVAMHTITGFTMHFDPSKVYLGNKGIDINWLIEANGYLLPWACDEGWMDKTAAETFTHFYVYGFYPWQDSPSTISDSGVYSYPGDPDLHPYVTMRRNDEVIHFYPHAIVAILHKPEDDTIDKRDDIVVRMD